MDWVGLDGYNWGQTLDHQWESFATVFSDSYRRLAMLTEKPMMIAETASAVYGGSKADWITEAFAEMPTRFPRVRAVVWFDREKERDWRIHSSPDTLAAFRRAAGSLGFSAPSLPEPPDFASFPGGAPCLQLPLMRRSNSIGPLQLALDPLALATSAGLPTTAGAGAWYYCAEGKGSVRIAFTETLQTGVILVRSRLRSAVQGFRGIHRGSSRQRLLRAFPRARRIAGGVYANRRLLFVVNRGEVLDVGLASREFLSDGRQRTAMLASLSV